MGLFFVTMLAVIFDDCRAHKIPAASGLSNFLRITAGRFATSLTTTFWDRRESAASVAAGRGREPSTRPPSNNRSRTCISSG
jgi:hypothetical protein